MGGGKPCATVRVHGSLAKLHQPPNTKMLLEDLWETLLLVDSSALSELEALASATPSNCGKLLRARVTKLQRKRCDGRGNDLGYGKNTRDWTIRSQVLRARLRATDAVHRLNGGGLAGSSSWLKI